MRILIGTKRPSPSVVSELFQLRRRRLASKVTDPHSIDTLAGRVLGHSEDESNGRSYMILEGTDHLIYFIYHSPEIEVMRREAKLKPSSLSM